MNNTEELFEKYKDDVFRLAISYTKSVQDAEDVCQNVFLKLLRQTDIQSGKEKHWLMRVTANECRSLLRSHWWKTTVPMEDCLSVPMAENEGILHQIMMLPPKYRVILYLHYYEGYSTLEIAKLLKISQSAVTTRLGRARNSLKKLIEEE